MADLIASNRKLIEDVLYRVRKMELDGRRRRVADPAAVSVVIPAFDEEEGIADVVRRVRAKAPWREVLVVDDGSTDETAARAAGGGGARGPPPLQQGQRGRGQDGDPRGARARSCCSWTRTASTTRRTWSGSCSPVGVHDMVIGARSLADQPTIRALGNAALPRTSPPGSPAGEIPDLTSGFRAARTDRLLEILHLLPNGFSYPTTSCLAFLKSGLQRGLRARHARGRGWAPARSACCATACGSCSSS